MKDKAKINKEEAVAEKPFTVRGEVYEWAQSLITALVICILVFVFVLINTGLFRMRIASVRIPKNPKTILEQRIFSDSN